jgi:hypothetical protein
MLHENLFQGATLFMGLKSFMVKSSRIFFTTSSLLFYMLAFCAWLAGVEISCNLQKVLWRDFHSKSTVF